MVYTIHVYKSGSAEIYDNDRNIINCCRSWLDAIDWLRDRILKDDDEYTFTYEYLQ